MSGEKNKEEAKESLWDRAAKESGIRQRQERDWLRKRDEEARRLASLPLPSMLEWEGMGGFEKFELAARLAVLPMGITGEISRRGSE